MDKIIRLKVVLVEKEKSEEDRGLSPVLFLILQANIH